MSKHRISLPSSVIPQSYNSNLFKCTVTKHIMSLFHNKRGAPVQYICSSRNITLRKNIFIFIRSTISVKFAVRTLILNNSVKNKLGLNNVPSPHHILTSLLTILCSSVQVLLNSLEFPLWPVFSKSESSNLGFSIDYKSEHLIIDNEYLGIITSIPLWKKDENKLNKVK